MVVAIISMAQQAKPNCSGQTELLRPQLYSSWSVVVKTPCLVNSLRSPSSMALIPGQNPFHPGPGQTVNQQQENRLHVKNQEEDGIHIILRLELDGRLPLRFEPAFINGILLYSRFLQ